MKSFIFVMASMVASATWAGETTSAPVPVGVANTQQQAQQSAQSSSSAAVNSGVHQNIVFTSPPDTTQRVVYSGSQEVKNVPSLSTSPLVSSNDTCHGSVTGGVVLPGFGISGGSTYIDVNCKRLKNSRELWNYGMRGAALALMCNDDENNEALEVTGYKCPEKRQKKSESQQYTDPHIRKRLNMD
jgi:hypothetical protein